MTTTERASIRLWRDTAGNWTADDPILAEGEPGYETDTGLLKIGDGATAWTGLAYINDATGGGGGSLPSAIYTKATAGATANLGSSLGDITVTGGAVVEVTVPAAAVGDTVTVGYAGQLADANSAYIELGAGVYSGGSLVRNVVPGANGTIPGWGFRNTEQYAHKAPSFPFVVQSGDLYSGTLTLRMRGKYAGGPARSFFADADNPFTFYAYNLGA